MNLGIRAILYSARKWKKTLLVFFLLLAITTLVLSGLAIADAQEEQAEEVRGTTGASFTVERNLSTGGWASGNSGSYSTQEFISEEMLQKISSVDGVAGYDAAVVSMPRYYNEAGEIEHFPVDNYYLEGKREAVFLGEKVIKYHRTLTTYLNELLNGGFEIIQVKEPTVSSNALIAHPEFKDELRRPMMLIVSARKK